MLKNKNSGSQKWKDSDDAPELTKEFSAQRTFTRAESCCGVAALRPASVAPAALDGKHGSTPRSSVPCRGKKEGPRLSGKLKRILPF
jgi:hypothetical protein